MDYEGRSLKITKYKDGEIENVFGGNMIENEYTFEEHNEAEWARGAIIMDDILKKEELRKGEKFETWRKTWRTFFGE